MINYILNHWLIIAFIAPFFWALVNIIDVYFVEEIYENEYDGTVITGLSQIIPWLIVPYTGLVIPEAKIIILAMLAGFCLVTAYFFYFKTLFITSDATLIQILWNILAILVPILAFLFLREKLTFIQYSGIIVTFLGAMYLTMDENIKEKNMWKVVSIMIGAIIFFSLMMIFTRVVYENTSFLGGIMFFSLGAIMAGLFFYILRIKKHGKGNLVNIGKKYFIWFLLAEGLTLAGIMTSQRAIDISPAVSFVAVVESIQPAFIIISSGIIYLLLKNYSVVNKETIKRIYNDQLTGIASKVFAIIIMAIGIFMINV
jgi:drug/metabolite transporter (DMT)-like permease